MIFSFIAHDTFVRYTYNIFENLADSFFEIKRRSAYSEIFNLYDLCKVFKNNYYGNAYQKVNKNHIKYSFHFCVIKAKS